MENLAVAIVGGTGNLGSALALRLGAPGVKIIIGSRDAEKAKTAIQRDEEKMGRKKPGQKHPHPTDEPKPADAPRRKEPHVKQDPLGE